MGRRADVGLRLEGAALRFRLWAPSLEACALHIGDDENAQLAAMTRDEQGYFSYLLESPSAEFTYALELPDGLRVPDPFSYENAGGVHARSHVSLASLAPRADDGFTGVPREQVVVMEIHVGAFTPEGTFAALAERLDDLARLGVTAIQLMPIWLTPGRWNWGYDPVSFFTINPNYGSVEEFKSLVAQAHQAGISVVLDCVFNHLGPEGAYLGLMANELFGDGETTPWGRAMGLEGAHQDHVRGIILASVEYWMGHIGVDGVRIDAGEYLRTHEMDFLRELSACVRRECRHENPIVILEHCLYRLGKDEKALVLAPDAFDCVWNKALSEEFNADDSVFQRLQFAMVRLAYDNISGEGGPDPIYFDHISFLRSHDTIGNSGRAGRNSTMDAQTLRAALPLLLLAPTTPMLFMGDDWLSDAPFHYFCDLNDIDERELVGARAREFPDLDDQAPTPMSTDAFEQSRLDWAQRRSGVHAEIVREVTELLTVRQRDIAPLIAEGLSHGVRFLEESEQWFSMTWRTQRGSRLTLLLAQGDVEYDAAEQFGEAVYSNKETRSKDQNGLSVTAFIDRRGAYQL